MMRDPTTAASKKAVPSASATRRRAMVLIGRQVNHAIGNHHIDGVVGQGNRLYFAFEKFDILNTGLALIFTTKQASHP